MVAVISLLLHRPLVLDEGVVRSSLLPQTKADHRLSRAPQVDLTPKDGSLRKTTILLDECSDTKSLVHLQLLSIKRAVVRCEDLYSLKREMTSDNGAGKF